VALVDALAKLPSEIRPPRNASGPLPERFNPAHYSPRGALIDQLAAVSVGVVDGEVRLDLDYHDDSRAEVDMNVAYTAGGKFVEIQGSAEGAQGFDRAQLQQMTDMAVSGCERIMAVQRQALGS
jgi:ribonuclease PH